MAKEKVENEKLVAILLYLIPIVGIIWYFADEKMKKSKFAKFHLKQVLILIILGFGISVIILGFGISVIGIIPILGWLIALLGSILIFVDWIIGLIAAINGKEKVLPLVGKFADKFTF
jgi:uncharacterized membrane protein